MWGLCEIGLDNLGIAKWGWMYWEEKGWFPTKDVGNVG
jgi:hypothetical protein